MPEPDREGEGEELGRSMPLHVQVRKGLLGSTGAGLVMRTKGSEYSVW